MTKPIIFYHHPCPDGMAAALAAFLHFGDEAEYTPINYGQDFRRDDLPGRVVYFVDFCPPRETIMELAGVCEKVVILDHHASAQKDVEFMSFPNLEIIFDMAHSGAVLAYQYFHGREKINACIIPEFFRLIEDRDLWKFSQPETKILAAYLQSIPLEIPAWLAVFYKYNDSECRESILAAGESILRMQDNLVARMSARPGLIRIGNHTVISACAPVLHSEVGNYLLDKYPYSPFAVTYLFDGNIVRMSLRSRKEDNVDVSLICAEFNGGGNKNTAGFESSPGYLAMMISNATGVDLVGFNA